LERQTSFAEDYRTRKQKAEKGSNTRDGVGSWGERGEEEGMQGRSDEHGRSADAGGRARRSLVSLIVVVLSGPCKVAVQARQKLLFQCRVPIGDSTGGEKRKWHRDRSTHKRGGKGRKKREDIEEKKWKPTTPTCLRWRH
jgi:hypothetical protein